MFSRNGSTVMCVVVVVVAEAFADTLTTRCNRLFLFNQLLVVQILNWLLTLLISLKLLKSLEKH